MLEDIRRAQKSILLESFILTDDSVTNSFFETLKEKARAGVRVKIIVDQVGHLWFGSVDREEFEKTGAEIIIFKRWLYRSHRKVLVVDDSIGYIGGVNIRGEYANWLDLHVRLTGNAVKHLKRSFARVYKLAGGKDPEILKAIKRPKAMKARAAIYKAKLWLIEHWPIKSRSALRAYYKEKCADAKKNIIIVTPYFLPRPWLIKALRSAAARGVKVEAIVPEKTDSWLADVANRFFADSLKDRIDFLFISEMNHAKVLLVDEEEGLVGSNNIDAFSFGINFEASVVFQRKDMVGDLKSILNRWKKTAAPFDPARYKPTPLQKLAGLLIKLLQLVM